MQANTRNLPAAASDLQGMLARWRGRPHRERGKEEGRRKRREREQARERGRGQREEREEKEKEREAEAEEGLFKTTMIMLFILLFRNKLRKLMANFVS